MRQSRARSRTAIEARELPDISRRPSTVKHFGGADNGGSLAVI
jgi:hypothetical protein